MTEQIALPPNPINCPGPVRKLIPPPPLRYHPSIIAIRDSNKSKVYKTADLMKLYEKIKNIAMEGPDTPLDESFEAICLELCGTRECYIDSAIIQRYTPLFAVTASDRDVGLMAEKRYGRESYENVFQRAFPRIRSATERRHEPGMEKFLEAHNDMRAFVTFYNVALSLCTLFYPSLNYRVLELFRKLLDPLLDTSRQ